MFLDLISNRRSIRKFKDKPVEQEKVNRLIEAALRSFSSRGFNPWRFIVIDAPQILKTLSRAKTHGSSFLSNAPLGIVVCAKPSTSDVWIEDTSIASTFIHLAAHDMGLGSCWIQIRKREHSPLKSSDAYVKEVLKIPDNITIESIIAIGYPDEIKKGYSKDSLQSQKICFNGYTIKD
ncbi:MAG: nitroreductase family protein [Pseudomonadota bacterium]